MASADKLLVRVSEEIGKGRIAETRIVEATAGVVSEGYQDGADIYIDPTWSTLDVVIHECLHRAYPGWGETYVRNRTRFLLNRMSNEQREALFAAYRRTARRRKTPVVIPKET